jgi:glycosyltransferase involved in cell wall biosynthesis
MPKVSVIIPTYNHACYLPEAIESVLDQTYRDFEVIVVDDGSSDNTQEVVTRFGVQVIYIRQENRGLPAARNTGIRASAGEYVAFLDADDWFLPHKLQKQAAYLDGHPSIGLVASGWIETDVYGRTLRTVKPWLSNRPFLLAECVLGVPLVVHCVLVRRAWLETVGLFDESIRWAEDFDLWLRLLADGCRFAWLPEVVCRRRFHGQNMSYSPKHMLDGSIAALDKLYARADLPLNVQQLHNLAYAMMHVLAIARACNQGLLDEAYHYLEQAIEIEPALLFGHPCRLIETLVGWSGHSAVTDRQKYLDALLYVLSGKVYSVERQLRKAMARLHMGHVFTEWASGEVRTLPSELLKALWLDPSWLLNRGVLSIALRSFLYRIGHIGAAREKDAGDEALF